MLTLTAAACSSETPAPVQQTVSAPTEVVQSSAVPNLRPVAGIVRSQTSSALSAKVLGNVVRVHVSEGDVVRAGQLLVEIDDRDGRAQSALAAAGRSEIENAIAAAAAAVQGAQANATLAEATFKRFSALRERRSVSAQEFEDVQARYTAAQAGLQQAKSTHAQLISKRGGAAAMSTQAANFLDYSKVRSPINGVVTARMVDAGAQAAPGMPLVMVEDPRSLRIEATVPEDLTVNIGDIVTIEADGQRFESRVTHIQPNVDAMSRSALIKIALDRPLRTGTYARVLFRTGERNAVSVPETAIARRGQLTSVLVVGADGIARMRLVTLGERAGNRIEILSGLDAGERIVLQPSGTVRDGVKIAGIAAVGGAS
ncbi:MAG: efflux RND transporter periplasmic adaptor subunit [Thermoanaerobaculia bacterium]